MYQGGVFKPLGALGLPENQRVRLSVQPDSEWRTGSAIMTWQSR
jgi:predicted DNA-binding antitoxin AbrB/MazE fold protein